MRTPLVEKQIADQARAHDITEAEVLDTVFLAMTAGYINGASLSIDGGWTAR